MKKAKSIFFYLLMICILLLSGFYRDFVFKRINALLQAWDHDMSYEMPNGLRFLENYDYDTIVNLKWLLTLLFSTLYLIIAIIVIRYAFHNKKYVKITVASYAGIIVFSGIFIMTGLLFKGSSEKMYEFARYFMGMAQSPIVLMVLIPAFTLYEKEKDKAQRAE